MAVAPGWRAMVSQPRRMPSWALLCARGTAVGSIKTPVAVSTPSEARKEQAAGWASTRAGLHVDQAALEVSMCWAFAPASTVRT